MTRFWDKLPDCGCHHLSKSRETGKPHAVPQFHKHCPGNHAALEKPGSCNKKFQTSPKMVKTNWSGISPVYPNPFQKWKPLGSHIFIRLFSLQWSVLLLAQHTYLPLTSLPQSLSPLLWRRPPLLSKYLHPLDILFGHLLLWFDSAAVRVTFLASFSSIFFSHLRCSWGFHPSFPTLLFLMDSSRSLLLAPFHLTRSWLL